ncbi:uncharacterized protein LOC107616294 [Arachis ipaensis]|uniref:uncharacterized protein LOC107616294 n=1 Tax=Arachis ipaensis TaxID=130454 RepID=UPI0007AF5057|nr:uncharacterized protein LOC107616294 [Arachis ipaensis]
MDAYSGYNRIPMYKPDQEKTSFITPRANYCYVVMPFELKSAGATYQRLMNKVFAPHLGNLMEVYVDDILVKTKDKADLLTDLSQVFNTIRMHGMRLNPAKCTFVVEAGKFLGFMLTQRGIESNPDKCRVVLEMKIPTCLREVQQLNGRLATLSRFLAGSALRTLPLFSLLRKGCQFEWTPRCKEAFQEFKRFLSQPPILTRPKNGEKLVLYLSVADKAVSLALIREDEVGQHPMYFTSKFLQGPELRYQKLEKFAYALIVASRRLRPYFQAHTIKVRMNQPMKQILQIDITGRMVQWAIELSEFDLSGADIILVSQEGTQIEIFLKFEFPASNNQAEYEALIAGLKLAEEVGTTKVVVFSDSQVVTSQINGEYQAKDSNMKRYLDKTLEHLGWFSETEVKHIIRDLNSRADALFKLATNGQAEEANKVILAGLKKRLQDAKGAWAEELPQVLWAYRTTPQSATGETPFQLAYGIEAMISVEISQQSPRVNFYGEVGNIQGHKKELELLPEVREQAQIREAALKQRMTNRYNKKVIRKSFAPNDLVLIRNDIGVNKSGEGKLAANWKGSYKISEVLGKGYYKVTDLSGTELPRSLHACNMKRYYS